MKEFNFYLSVILVVTSLILIGVTVTLYALKVIYPPTTYSDEDIKKDYHECVDRGMIPRQEWLKISCIPITYNPKD